MLVCCVTEMLVFCVASMLVCCVTEMLVSWLMPDMFYPIHPEGLYTCLKRMSKLGIPMYITETGISDSKDDRRAVFINGYFKAVSETQAFNRH
jgi:hypothetical protein